MIFDNVYDKKQLESLKNMNNTDVKIFQRYIYNRYGLKVPRKTLEEVALNKLLTCYNKQELMMILQHFNQLPGDET